ncbi:unnamed protein product [Dracunculus medinensis]|uniref:WAPL domain-containing protein n=1 Tax=Dracunculus medinensis TaxID=318479 RepID=A0A3P7SUL0_DRAME|nr:unnamed protein product [Dracunculus medinensis]
MVYKHKFFDDDEIERKTDTFMSFYRSPNIIGPNTGKALIETRVKNVKEAHQCLESGAKDDFTDDIEYALSTLTDPLSTPSLKCLSIISLSRKCISSEFRQFFRSQNFFGKIVKTLGDSNMAICISSMIYLISRDTVSLDVDAVSLRLFNQLLKWDKPKGNGEYMRFSKMSFFQPSFLVLESLVYICARKTDNQILKKELLNLGILQWIVSKCKFFYTCLKILERCLRVLESAIVCNKKNQAFLISHRGSLLIQSSVKFVPFFLLFEQSITCLSRVAGLLMNMSHENELCSTKLGQMSGFLPLCMSSFTYLVPKFAAKEKRFDLTVLVSVIIISDETIHRNLFVTVLFVYHESIARSIDEELDNDLVLEDVPDDSNCTDDDDDGRLHRLPAELTEDEMIETVQKAMNKASKHMEDSVLASYFALLIGCLLQQNEVIKSELSGGKLTLMIEQLQRFLEFMKISIIK